MEFTFANSDDHVFKVHKTSSADGRNLMGAKFEVKGIDNDFVNTYTTDALGEFTIQGRDLPTGSFEVYEIAAPEGYVLIVYIWIVKKYLPGIPLIINLQIVSQKYYNS